VRSRVLDVHKYRDKTFSLSDLSHAKQILQAKVASPSLAFIGVVETLFAKWRADRGRRVTFNINGGSTK
jgi:hypothetical protein